MFCRISLAPAEEVAALHVHFHGKIVILIIQVSNKFYHTRSRFKRKDGLYLHEIEAISRIFRIGANPPLGTLYNIHR